DGAGAAVELDHPFGGEQHVRLLRCFPLQAHAACHGGPAVRREPAHGDRAEASAMASFICHSTSSLNCRISSARSCVARVVNQSSVTASPNSTSRRARLTRLWK